MSRHPYAPGIDRLFAVLGQAEDPLTLRQLSDQAHLGIGTLQGGKYLPELTRLGLIHVAEWRRQPMGRLAGAYVLGPGKPPRRPPFCKLAAARERKRKSGYDTRRKHANALRRAPGMLAFLAQL